MLPTRIIRASHRHTPLIHFIGKRQKIEIDHTRKPHPQAPGNLLPGEVGSTSSPYINTSTSSSPSLTSASSTKPSSSSNVLDFFDLPARYRYDRHPLTEEEIEAVMTGGASKRIDQSHAAFIKPRPS